MRSIVIYCSMTGNTKTIATAILQGIGPDCELVSLGSVTVMTVSTMS